MRLHFDHEARVDVLGPDADRAVLFVHGMGGSREDAAGFSHRAAAYDWQTVSIDMPGGLLPWQCIPLVEDAYAEMATRWDSIALRATSIGAWFALVALQRRPMAWALLESPLVDMVALISSMMAAVGTDREQLREAGRLPGPDGSTLTWRYLSWAEEHVVPAWPAPTSILVGSEDEVLPPGSVHSFATRFGCQVAAVEGGAHWLRTDRDLAAIAQWEEHWLQTVEHPVIKRGGSSRTRPGRAGNTLDLDPIGITRRRRESIGHHARHPEAAALIEPQVPDVRGRRREDDPRDSGLAGQRLHLAQRLPAEAAPSHPFGERQARDLPRRIISRNDLDVPDDLVALANLEDLAEADVRGEHLIGVLAQAEGPFQIVVRPLVRPESAALNAPTRAWLIAHFHFNGR